MATQIGLDANLSINDVVYQKPDFVELVKQIKPDIIRTPGSVVNPVVVGEKGFRWRQDHPSPDDVKLMWDVVQCKLIWVLNVVDKGWLNNLNMLRKAAELNLPTDYVEAGNELNINQVGRQRFPSVDDYAALAKDWWYNHIKPEFPNTKLLLVGQNKSYGDLVRWNKTCLDAIPEAYMVEHWHCDIPYVDEHGMPNVDIINTAIDEAFNDEMSDVPMNRIAVTEFQLKSGTHEDKASPDLSPEGEELAVKTMLEKFTSLGVELACFHNILGANGNGAIDYNRWLGKGIQPSGIAIQKFINTRT